MGGKGSAIGFFAVTVCIISITAIVPDSFAQTGFRVGVEAASATQRYTDDLASGVSYALLVTNFGLRPDTIELSINAPAGLFAAFRPNTVTLLPAETASVQLTITGVALPPGDYPLTVTGRSRGDRAQTDAVALTLTVVEPQVVSTTLAFDEASPSRASFLANPSGVPLRWVAVAPPWVTVAPEGGALDTGTTPVQVTVDFDALPPGTHLGELFFVDTERSENVKAVLLEVNRQPRFKPTAPRQLVAGEFLEFVVSASDLEGDAVTVVVDDLPAGAFFEPRFGLFGWHTRPEQAGGHTLTFRATDDFDPPATATLNVSVTLNPNLEFSVRLFPGRAQMIHIPVADPRFKRVSDLFSFLQPQAEQVIFWDTFREQFRAYTQDSQNRPEDDFPLKAWTGLVVINRTIAPPRTVVFQGPKHAETQIPLEPGINLIGLPVKDAAVQTLTDLSMLSPAVSRAIGQTVEGRFRDAPADDFAITGGQGFIVFAKEGITLSLTGEGWSNSEVSGLAPPQRVQHEPSPQTAILPNYPNPFNPETWLPFALAEDAHVRIHIYAVDGTVVRDLDLGWRPSGAHTSRSQAAYWDGRNAYGEGVASGVYFYTLTAYYDGGRSEVVRSPHKLVVLR